MRCGRSIADLPDDPVVVEAAGEIDRNQLNSMRLNKADFRGGSCGDSNLIASADGSRPALKKMGCEEPVLRDYE